jgi:hypothetical protein
VDSPDTTEQPAWAPRGWAIALSPLTLAAQNDVHKLTANPRLMSRGAACVHDFLTLLLKGSDPPVDARG